jgi:MFS family permease
MRAWPWSILLHALFLQLATYVVRPTAAYRALELGVSPAYLGLIAASFAIVPLLVAVLLGSVADSGGETALMVVGAVLMVISGVGLLFWSHSLLLLLTWNVLLGLGHLMSVLGEQSRVAQTEEAKLDSAFGIYTFAGSVGQAIGPSLIAVFGGAQPIPNTGMLFAAYLVAASLMLGTTVVMVGRSGGRRANKLRSRQPRLPLRQALLTTPTARRQLLGAMAVSMMTLAAVDLVAVYLPALGVERGIPAAVIGLLLTVRAAATMISRLGLGLLVSKFGRQNLVIASTALSGVTMAALALPMEMWAMTLVLTLAGVTLGIGQPLTMTVISLTAPPRSRSTWLALRLSANRLGQSALPAAVGLVAAGAGAAGVFGMTAGALVVTAGLTWHTRSR